jgi:hypothetical protein
MHVSGLRAIQAVASSDTFLLHSKIEDYVKVMVPAILSNISKLKVRPQLDNQNHSAGHHHNQDNSKRISIADDLFTHQEVEHTAENSLSQLISRTNATTLSCVLNPILTYFDEKNAWPATSYIIHVVKIITSAVQPQYLHILLSSILDRLNSDTYAKDSVVKITLVQSLSYLVAHGGESVGVAVLELLEALARQILVTVTIVTSADSQAVPVSGSGAASVLSAGTKEVDKGAFYFQSALVDAVGSLAVNIEYPDQVNDIIAFLINKLKVSREDRGLADSDSDRHSAKQSREGMPADETGSHRSGSPTTPVGADPALVASRKILLRCLARVVAVRRHHLKHPASNGGAGVRTSVMSTASRRSSTLRSPITATLLGPILCLLGDHDAEIRLGIAEFLYQLLSLEVLECGIGGLSSPLAGSASNPNLTSPQAKTSAAISNAHSIMASIASLVSVGSRSGTGVGNGVSTVLGSGLTTAEFLASLYRHLYEYAVSPFNGPSDYVAIGCLLIGLLQRYFYVDGLAATVPVLFKIQVGCIT